MIQRPSVVERLKPAVAARTRLLLAAGLWLGVGLGLGLAGARWLHALSPRTAAGAALSALAAGWVKGRFLLAPRAAANAQRIRRAGEGRCAGGAFAVADWLVVALMMGLGALLRASPLARPVLGWIYLTAGMALCCGSLPAWRAWRGTAAAGRPG